MLSSLFGLGNRGNKTIIPRDKFRGSGDHSFRTSDAMEQLMQDKTVKEMLNRPEEQRAFFKEMEKYGRDTRGLTVDDMRKVLGTLRSEAGGAINRIEARKLAEKLIPSSYKGEKRFDVPEAGVEPPKKKPTSIFPF
jgi:hypothetical protein